MVTPDVMEVRPTGPRRRSVVTSTSRRRHTPRAWVQRGGPSALVFALPALFVFGWFSWLPIARAVVMSFQKTNLIVTSWVGLQNFQRVLADPVLPIAIRNTLWFALLALVFGFPVPLGKDLLGGDGILLPEVLDRCNQRPLVLAQVS